MHTHVNVLSIVHTLQSVRVEPSGAKTLPWGTLQTRDNCSIKLLGRAFSRDDPILREWLNLESS